MTSELQNWAILSKSEKSIKIETEFLASILIKKKKGYCSKWVTLQKTGKKCQTCFRKDDI